MSGALSGRIDVDRHRETFRTDGWVQIDDVLTQPAADELHRYLDRDASWSLSYLRAGRLEQIPAVRLAQMTAGERTAQEADVAAQAARGFQFRFMRAPLPSSGLAEELMALGRAVAGDPEIRRASTFASYYPPGSYLRSHDDATAGGGRRAAYVLNLTRRWEADWGGLLVLEEAGPARLTRVLFPRFNSLTMFAVPRSHHVTLVREYAAGQRYAVHGWFADDEAKTPTL